MGRSETAATHSVLRTPTTDWGYLRLRREAYTDDDLRTWKAAIEAQPWREAFVFFRHEDEGAAPLLARRLLALD